LYKPSKKMVHVSESEDHFNFLSEAAVLWIRYRRTILVISAALLILIVLLSGSQGSKSLYWPGWYVLRTGPDAGSVDGQLENAGITDFISADNSRVEYMDIPRIRQLAVSEIDDVLVPGDPRRDPYLSGVHKLFESDESSLIYLPSGPGMRYYRKILRGIAGSDDWELMDDTGAFPGLTVFFIFTSLALLIALTTGLRVFSPARIISIMPLSLYVLIGTGGMSMVFPLLLTFFLSPVNFIKQGSSKGKLYNGFVYAGYTAALVSILNMNSGTGVPALAAALLSSELINLLSPFLEKAPRRINAAQPGKRQLFRKRHEHQLFAPLSLMQPARGASRLSLKTVGSFLAVFCTVATLFLPADFGSHSEHTPIPHAVPGESGFDDWSSFITLDGKRNASNLPDAALMLSSAAFQEGFLFGSDFRLPLPGDSLSIRSFNDDGDGLSVAETVVKNYDRSWYESVLERELSHGAGLLFASLGGPSSVFSISHVPGIEETHLNRIQIALYGIAVMVMLLLTIFPHRGNAPVRSIYKPIMNARRRAQAA